MLAAIARRSSIDNLITLHSETEAASIDFQLLNVGDTVETTRQIYQDPLAVFKD